MADANPGSAVAQVLSGSWRRQPAPLDPSLLEAEGLAPLLSAGSAGGLAWWRLRGQPGASTARTQPLQAEYRRHAFQRAFHERDLLAVVRLLRSHGIEPLVVKGWAVARHYPDPGLRPCGDIDLCVPPEQYQEAQERVHAAGRWITPIDLHAGYYKLPDLSPEELFAGSLLVPLGDEEIRVLRPEHHLRLVILHLLGHGAWRPLWLCDVAALLEDRTTAFDWEQCLGRDPVGRNWVAATLRLAEQVLGAEASPLPSSDRGKLPAWVAEALLHQWCQPGGAGDHAPLATVLRLHWRSPRHLATELRDRWREPIQAFVELGLPFDHRLRLPVQLRATLHRALGFARHTALGLEPGDPGFTLRK